MWKFLLGPLLLGAGYIVGSIYGADAEQIVRKAPSATYSGVEQALDNVRGSGTTSFDGGTPVPYQIKVDRSPDERLLVTVYFGDRQGASADFRFAPRDNDATTLMSLKIHGDHAVLRQALAGTDKARLGYAPDWMLNLAARPLLKQLATQIEQGQAAGAALPGFQSQADWESSLPPDEQQKMQAWRQYDASRPTSDPDADARRYMDGGNSAGN
ncbi:MAG TPA: hypothetical protein VF067_01530 [Sphingomicrobium sp.]